MSSSKGAVEALLLTVIVGLTLATGYIHSTLGGIMLTLNSLGYLTLAGAVVVSAVFFRRFLPLVLIALAGYAAVTIVGWAIMGPYYNVAYLAKGIEIALIVTIAVTLRRMADETRAALSWAMAIPATLLGRGNKPAGDGGPAAPTNKS
jgi:hypothetical protein